MEEVNRGSKISKWIKYCQIYTEMAKDKQLRHEDSSETCLASSMSHHSDLLSLGVCMKVFAPLWYVLARQQLICHLAIASCHLHLQSTVSRVRTCKNCMPVHHFFLETYVSGDIGGICWQPDQIQAAAKFLSSSFNAIGTYYLHRCHEPRSPCSHALMTTR